MRAASISCGRRVIALDTRLAPCCDPVMVRPNVASKQQSVGVSGSTRSAAMSLYAAHQPLQRGVCNGFDYADSICVLAIVDRDLIGAMVGGACSCDAHLRWQLSEARISYRTLERSRFRRLERRRVDRHGLLETGEACKSS